MPPTPLLMALRRGHCREVERLCQQHPELVNADVDWGTTPLHMACGAMRCFPCPHCVRVLLEAGADVSAADDFLRR